MEILHGKDFLTSYKDFLLYLNSGTSSSGNVISPSVSMHVRHGDSCVKILNHKPDLKKENLILSPEQHLAPVFPSTST